MRFLDIRHNVFGVIHRCVIAIVGAAVVAVGSLAVGGQASAATGGGDAPSGVSTRIIGGTPTTTLGVSTRFFAVVQPNPNELCAGTVIGEHTILTAAHCLQGRRNPTIAVNPSRFDPSSFVPHGTFRIKWQSAIAHPGFDPNTLVNDVAVIRVKPVLTAQTLPYAADASTPELGDALQVFGFGLTSENGNVSPVNRMASIVDLGGPSTTTCGSYTGSNFVAANEICAGVNGGGVDSCNGDSGGPLTTATEPRTIVGVVSSGQGCAEPNFPGVYTRISTNASWVQSVTGIAPGTAAHNTYGPAYLVASKPCSGLPCSIDRLRSSSFYVTNYGGHTASFRVTGSGFRSSIRSGHVGASSSQQVVVRPTNGGSPKCVSGKVRSNGKTLTSFRFGVGGKRC